LTREIAVQKLLKANRHIDEGAASLLLERAMIVNQENKLEFSRDLRFKQIAADHFVDFFVVSSVINNLSPPLLSVHASPPAYGENAYKSSIDFINQLKKETTDTLEITTFDSTHHFHMLQPEKAAGVVNDFLKKHLFK